MSSSVAVLLRKLKDPHPTVQRYAVRSIFEVIKAEMDKKKSSQTESMMLAECMMLASRSVTALEEALSHLCALVAEEKYILQIGTVALSQIQATLECAPSQVVPSVVRAIGFICSHLLSTHSGTLTSLRTYELHPFVKAFRSRRESHSEITRMVIALLIQKGLSTNDVLPFLQPFFSYIFLQPLAHNEDIVATRDLYFSLASLTSLNFALGILLIRLLMQYAYLMTSQTTAELDWKTLALRELVDALENLVIQASLQEEVEDCKMIAVDIQAILIDTCHESNKQKLSFGSLLELLGRVVRMQKSLETGQLWRHKILNLAQLLTMTSIKEEQILLIGLTRDVLREKNRDGLEMLISSSHALPHVLLWVYPTVNIMATSCTILKSAAAGLLQDIEDLLALDWSQKSKITHPQLPALSIFASYGQLADNMHIFLLQLWFGCDDWKTWNWINSMEDLSDGKGHDIEALMLRLLKYTEDDILINSNAVSEEAFAGSQLIAWICMLFSVFLIHPYHSCAAARAISEIGNKNPVKGFSFVPVVLFYLKAWKRHWKGADSEHLMRLLKVLPTLAKHPMSSSVIAGTFQSLLQSTSVLQRTAIRLICRTWQVADTVFPILEVELDESHFLVPIKDFETVLCRAASLSDVCKQDADRGVELILSIQACIRSENVVIKAYGLQSLSWLCNHDVIDFYTAWDVLSSSFSELPSSSILGESLCCFLQNGSLDAAAYPESSVKALQLLWKATTVPHESCSSFDWWMVQEKALNALSSFEVEDLIRSSRELKISPAHILLCENHPEVLRACESLIVKFLYHEYKFRNRGTEKERNTGNKLGKIFSALPQILSTSVQKEPSLLRYPAAFMLIKGQVSQTLGSHSRHVSKDWENEFQQQFTEMADHTDLHGNLICGLLYLKVWYFYLYEKLREKSSSNVIISNVALRFLKVLCDISKEAIPRVAENAILAIAVLYQITAFEDPMAAGFRDLHESVVSFLKSCIAQESHEYLQWTSAAALGYVAQYSNTADWRFKLEVSVTLLECLSRSDRDIVRGACNLGLGFLFQNLLTQNEILDSGIYKERMQEVHICDFIFDKLRTLMLTWCPEVSDSLENISVKKDTSLSSNWSEVLLSLPTIMPFKKFEEGTWTLAGLAIALGSSVTALERIGLLEPLSKVTSLLIKVADMSQKNDGNKDLLNSFALGAYISLPLCMKACLRLQILREEFDSLIADIQDYMISVKSTGSSAFPEYKMAACIGSGNVFSILLSLRTYKLQRSSIFSVIESLKSLAVCNNNELLSLGGFVGLANVLGAGTALLIPEPKYRIDDSESLGNMNGAVESINICAPLLYETSCKEYVQTLLQYIVNAAIKGFDRTKPNAWLTLALIRRTFMKGIDTERYLSDSRGIKTLKMSMDGLAKDSTLYLLCDWLLNMKENLMDPSFPYHSLASVLRCLRQAPKLPNLEWGAILRKLFHDITSTKEYPSPEFKNFKVQDDLFSECMLFSLAHAQSFSGLQTCLDELCDLALLLSLRTSMASILMVHMNKLSYIFSKSRLERFVFECVEATWRRSQSNHSQNLSSGDDVECLKVNLWKGLKSLLSLPKDDLRVGVDKNKLLVAAEKCLSLLEPPLEKSPRKLDEIQEWSEALECMVLASDEWIAKLTEIDQNESVTTIPARSYIVKKIYLTSQLVARHRLQSAALMNPIKWLRNQTVNEAYPLLLWIVYALRDVKLEDKQSWLMDVLEMVFCSTNSETVVVFLALLTSSWCPYSTFILVDGSSVLQLLPFTLSSLLSEQSWRAISKGILQRCVSLLFNAAETNLNSVAHGSPLWYVKKACIILRNSLPLQDQVRLVDDLW